MLQKNAAITFLAVMTGVLLGLGSFTMYYGEGLSYFSTDPRACKNCHIMQSQFDSWQKSSHHSVANCVQCHLPHSGIDKFIAKAENGFLHSKAFTLQDFDEPIFIRERNKKILHNNCMQCHEALVHEITVSKEDSTEPLNCLHCHNSVGHGESMGMGRFVPYSDVKSDWEIEE